MELPGGGPAASIELARRHVDGDPSLRAFDAADELALAEVDRRGAGGVVVTVEDGFGALAVGLAAAGSADRIGSFGDSWSSHRAMRANLERNGLATDAVTSIGSLDDLPPTVDTLIIRPGRSLTLLEQHLRRLRPTLHGGSVVITAEMSKHLRRQIIEVLDRVVGPTSTSLADRRARLAISEVRAEPDPSPWPWPVHGQVPVMAAGSGDPSRHVVRTVDHAGIFSAGRPDAGTAALLAHLPRPAAGAAVVDLGCGNGVLGTAAAMVAAEPGPGDVLLVDDSYLAVASARGTVERTLGASAAATQPVRVLAGDGLADGEAGPPCAPSSVDLVLLNPPFHAGRVVTDDVAWRMFVDARRALRRGGELWVVGNRHLGYHAKLRRTFGNADVVASDPRFVVLRATRR